MAAAEMPVRLKGQTTCGHHKGKKLEFYCEQCKEPVCAKCVTYLHKGHMFCDLSEITPQKKEKIRNFIDKTEQNVLQDIGKYIASANTLLTENDSTFNKLSKDLKVQSEKLKQDLDKLTTETLALYQKMREDNTKLIHNYRQDLEIYEKQLKHQMQDCKKVLQHGSPIEINDTECEEDTRLNIPMKPVLLTVSFTPNKNPRKHLELALGIFVDSGQTPTLAVKDRSVSPSHGQGQSSTYKQSSDTRKKAVTRTKLLTEAKVVEEWTSPCHIDSICPTTDDRAWTSGKYSKTLTLLDRKSRVIQEVKDKAYITDISLSPKTQKLWACDGYNNILNMASGQLSVRFRTKDQSECMCVTADNHIIIGMPKHVTKYTTKGHMVLTTKAAGTAIPLVCSPWKITECPITNNVAVIDASDIDDGGDGNKHVVVMKSDFQQIFVYSGDIPSKYRETSQSPYEPFQTLGIVYDNQGNIIITDYDKIIRLNDGEVLNTLYTDTVGVWDVGLSRQGVLWTVNMKNNVKLLKYSTTSKQRKTEDLLK